MTKALSAVPLATILLFASGTAAQEEKSPRKPILPPAPTVKLVDPGQEPRQALRFRPAAGSRQRVQMAMQMTMGQGVEEGAIEMRELPETSLPMDIEIKETRPNGDIAFACRYGKIEVRGKPGQEAMVEGMRSVYAGMEGLGLDSVMTNRGITVEAKLVVPKDLNATMQAMLEGMQQSLNQMSFPLPEEPVGKGAKWEVVQKMTSQGITQTVSATYALKEIQGNGLELASEVKVKADEQVFEIPMMPGQKVKLLSLSGGGTGTIKGDLSALLGTSTSMEMSTDNRIEMAPGTAMTTKMKMSLKVSRREETPSRP